MRTDIQADMTKLIVTFRNFAEAPKMHQNICTVRKVWDSRGSVRIIGLLDYDAVSCVRWVQMSLRHFLPPALRHKSLP